MPFLIHPSIADEITCNWPVTDSTFIDALHAVWTTHNILPLPVYDEQWQYVEPVHVSSVLKGSLVKLHFRLKHYFIKRETGNYDTFTGTIEQIIVLKRGSPEVKSPYRKDIHKGLFYSVVLPVLFGCDSLLGPFTPSHSEQTIATGNFLKLPHLIPSGLGASSKVPACTPAATVVMPSTAPMSSNLVAGVIPDPSKTMSLTNPQKANTSPPGATAASGSGKTAHTQKRKSKEKSSLAARTPSTQSKATFM